MSEVTADHINEEMHQMVFNVVNTREPGENIKSMIGKAGHWLGIKAGRCRKIYHKEIRNFPAHEYLTVRQRYIRWLERREAALDEELKELRTMRAERLARERQLALGL